jgi:folate-dependent phosphoribosylglycinamide formyltransferase PurN
MAGSDHLSRGETGMEAHGMSQLRVVLLAQSYRLTRFLEEKLAEMGNLVGIVHEQQHPTVRSRMAFMANYARRFGIGRALDVFLYQLHQRLFRRKALGRAAEAIVPLTRPADALHGIPRYTVVNLNHGSAQELIRAMEPDVVVVHATRILKPETFQLARRCAMNLHCGILPDYRGHDTMFWPLYHGDFHKLGVTIHLLEKRVDAGAVLRQGYVKWEPGDTDITVWFKAFALGVELVLEVIEALQKGEWAELLPPGRIQRPHCHRKGLSHYVRYVLRSKFRGDGYLSQTTQ